MSIKIFDTFAGEKKDFKPISEGEVKMYVCGPTVYDFLHVGNFRGPIFFNLVRNWFEKSGFKVTYVYNYTDVDDKIIERANHEGVTAKELSEKYINEFETDYKSLKLKPHSLNPKVSDHIEYIVEFIAELISKEKAYELHGDVYFDVPSFKEYGGLSNKNIDEMQEGYRIDADTEKKHSADFALWKKAKPGEPSWPSPWGEGRPGWHIECSAMTRKILGDTIDIHGGGLDLVFPHHENEIAQSEGCTGHKYVNYWMHNNMLEFGRQKMSKSLGNIKSCRDFVKDNNAEILKFMNLLAHYRSTIDFSESQIDNVIHSLARFYSALKLAKENIKKGGSLAPLPEDFKNLLMEADDKISTSLDDDFNTPEVFAVFYEVTREFNKKVRGPGKITDEKISICETYYHWLRSKGELMSLFNEDAESFLIELDDMLLLKKGLSREQIDRLVDQRKQARQSKDYARSDELRDQLSDLGISVMDNVDGSQWEVHK